MALRGVPDLLEAVGTSVGEIIAGAFSASIHASILEYFDYPPFLSGWTLPDSLAIWYCLGHLCMLSSFQVVEREIPPAKMRTMLDSGLHGLLKTWTMPKNVHDRFAAFNSNKLRSALAAWFSLQPILADAAEMQRYVLIRDRGEECTPEAVSTTPVLAVLYGFFSLFVSEILNGDTSFEPMRLSDLSLRALSMPVQMLPPLKMLSRSFLGTQRICVEFIRSQHLVISRV